MSRAVNKEDKKPTEPGDFIRIKPVLRASPVLLVSFILTEAIGVRSLFSDGELAFLIPAGFLFLAKPAWQILTNTYEIRRNGISAIHGFIAIDSIDVPVNRIITVEYKQSVMGRLLGFGNVYIQSAAQDSPDIVMRNVANPKAIRNGIRAILKEVEAKRAVPAHSDGV